jgi:hypothetical protein
LTEFEQTQVLIWTQRFKNHSGERLETLAVDQVGEADWLVESRLIRPQGPPVFVQWRVHRAADARRSSQTTTPSAYDTKKPARQKHDQHHAKCAAQSGAAIEPVAVVPTAPTQ